MRVSLFITCLGDSYFPRAGIAAVKVLERLGCAVDFPAGQTCCGQPMHNNGFAPEARALAARMIRIFAASEHIVTVSGSCASMVREHYPAILADSPDAAAARALAEKTFEFGEFLVNVLKVDLAALGVRWTGRATYHYSCHLRGIGVTTETPRLLRQIEGLELTPLENPEQCCGFGGTFSTKYDQISAAMARDKAAAIRASGAGTVVSSEPGCTMNIAGACRRAGHAVDFKSLPEIIAEGMGLLEPGPPRAGEARP
ncbi:MAG: (Fe-S)-binding protein [Phycisphaerales bacterium]|nr:(Fe-S)-binding protein [Phycisphaerales bacterium]